VSAVVFDFAFDDGTQIDEPALRVAVPERFYADG
jgi:hypothetical protein